jgi:peptidoglycan/LPS O-acetylase OafA/YrhL
VTEVVRAAHTATDTAVDRPVAAPPQEPPPHPVPAPAKQRLQFLDAVRGIAAFTVAVQHCIEAVSPGYLRWSHEVFRPGEWGVILFFISSGFIIPVSLERYQSVGRFWIGRVFRLYPLYWVVSGAALVLFALDRFPLEPLYRLHWVRATGANITMAQEFVGQPHVLGQAWTLSYELVFYFLVSLLFLVKLDGKPHLVLGVGLATAVGIGTLLPPRLLTDEATPDEPLVIGVACAVAAGAAAWFARSSWTSAAAAALFSVLVVALLANREDPPWFAALLLSSMFVGWILHRWSVGRVSGLHAVTAVAAGCAAILVAHGLHFQQNTEPTTGARTNLWAESATFLGAYAVFLLFVALRRHAFPTALRWLGEVSYSVYLVHGVVLAAVPRVGGRATAVAVWLGLTLVASWVTYRLVERPFQEWGRRVARRVASTTP